MPKGKLYLVTSFSARYLIPLYFFPLFQMSSIFFTVYGKALTVLWLLTLILHVTSSNETNKPGTLGTYCYEDFLAAWGKCCGNKYPGCVQAALNSVKQAQQGRRKRQIEQGIGMTTFVESKAIFSYL